MYAVGALVRVSAWFVSDGQDVDPSAVQVSIRTPAGVITHHVHGTDAQVVRDSTGRYHYDVSVTASGDWYYRWLGSGTYQAADEQVFKVTSSQFST